MFGRNHPEVFCNKKSSKKFHKIHRKTPVPESFLHKVTGCNFIKKETLAQVFSCEFCEISKNTLFYRTHLVVASVYYETAGLSKFLFAKNKYSTIFI